MGLLLYPFLIIIFWYRDVCFGIYKKSAEIFIYGANLLSVPLLLKTFFKPLKNEYRQGLVLFSIVMGVIIKLVLLSISFIILFLLLSLLILLNALVVLMPAIIIGTLIS